MRRPPQRLIRKTRIFEEVLSANEEEGSERRSGLVLFLSGQELLRAQAAFPEELPGAPLPRQSAVVGIEQMAQTNSGAPAQSDPFDRSDQSNQSQDNNVRQQNKTSQGGFPPVSASACGRPPVPQGSRPMIPGVRSECLPNSSSAAETHMSCNPGANPYVRFLDFSGPSPLTPKQKFLLAWRGVSDPYNLLTIGGEAAFTIGTDAHTAYGPGFPGFGKYAGVSLTQDISAEFLGAFLIPALAHQDPRYRREPNLSLRRRIIHVVDSVWIGQDDNGLPMFNYANVFGTIGTSALGNLYVPGRQTSWGS